MNIIDINTRKRLHRPSEPARNAATRLIHEARRAGCVTVADLAVWLKARQIIRGGVL